MQLIKGNIYRFIFGPPLKNKIYKYIKIKQGTKKFPSTMFYQVLNEDKKKVLIPVDSVQSVECLTLTKGQEYEFYYCNKNAAVGSASAEYIKTELVFFYSTKGFNWYYVVKRQGLVYHLLVDSVLDVIEVIKEGE